MLRCVFMRGTRWFLHEPSIFFSSEVICEKTIHLKIAIFTLKRPGGVKIREVGQLGYRRTHNFPRIRLVFVSQRDSSISIRGEMA